jgi:hypothetical protein
LCLPTRLKPLAERTCSSQVGGAEHNGKRAAVRRYRPEKERYELELFESGRRMDVRGRDQSATMHFHILSTCI